jgi:hypothetical protein
MAVRELPDTTQRAKESRSSGVRPQERKETWHAVSIVTPNSCCEAAQALRNHRFLSKDAPRLPLAGCSAPESCQCIYRHHADRRAKPRRATDRGELPRPSDDAERRGQRGRRADDYPEDE